MPLTMWPMPSRAHHGWGQFISERPWFVEGVLIAVSWQNPHPTIGLRVVSPSNGQPWMSWQVPEHWKTLDTDRLLPVTHSPAEVVGEWEVGFGSLWRQKGLGFNKPPRVGDSMAMVAVRHCTPSKKELRALLVQYQGKIIQQQSHRLPAGCSGRQTG
jgi:hypothetical protein